MTDDNVVHIVIFEQKQNSWNEQKNIKPKTKAKNQNIKSK